MARLVSKLNYRLSETKWRIYNKKKWYLGFCSQTKNNVIKFGNPDLIDHCSYDYGVGVWNINWSVALKK
jgi:hypothetical protein